LHFTQPQWNKTGNLQQIKSWKIFKYMANKQYIPEWPALKIKQQIKKFLESSDSENNLLEHLGHSKGITQRKFYTYECVL
jgi:hypothetical protein